MNKYELLYSAPYDEEVKERLASYPKTIGPVQIGDLYFTMKEDWDINEEWDIEWHRTAEVTKLPEHGDGDNYPGLTIAHIPSIISYDDEEFNVIRIALGAFMHCRSLRSVIIPDSIVRIEDYAFAYCPNLTSVEIHDSVTHIGDSAFLDCKLVSVKFPDSVLSVRDMAFFDTLVAVYNRQLFAHLPTAYVGIYTIPDGIQTIAEGAFGYHTQLTSIVIPDSVTYIGDNAFYHCDALTCMTCNATLPPTLGKDVFLHVNTSIPLYVPAESIELYKTAPQWQQLNIQRLPNSKGFIKCVQKIFSPLIDFFSFRTL